MGLFSRNKKKEDLEEDKKVPKTFPETAMDKYSGEFTKASGYKEDDAEVHVQEKSKTIPKEILSPNTQKRTTFSPEIRYIRKEAETAPQHHEHPEPVKENHHEVRTIYVKEVPVPSPITKDEETAVNKEHPKEEKPKFKHHSNFVEELKKLVHVHKKDFHKMDSKELVNKFKDYHESLKTGHDFFMHESEIDNKLDAKMEEVRDLETDWLELRKTMDSAERVLFEKESMLEKRFDELKSLIMSGEKYRVFHTKCSEEQAFVLADGRKVFSIQELLYLLPHMSDEIFYKHVNSEKNDFVNWIKHVFRLEDLADSLVGIEKKADFITKMKSY